MAMLSGVSNRGFTLIELVVGIVVMAVALTLLSSLFFSNPARSVTPILQIRAAVFGQALVDEILGKAFDESTPVGGVPACTLAATASTLACTAPANLGSDGEARTEFDDVDDYHAYCNPGAPVNLIDAEGNTPNNSTGYFMSVCVNYDGNYDGVSDTNIAAKLITVSIYPPEPGAGLAQPITFTAYRGNF